MNFVDALDYFKAFFEINKSNNPQFSHRSFAAKIKWPSSYLSDLIVGRKQLSVQRALQFSEHFKMNALNQERLLWFALANSKSAYEKDFFEKKLRRDPNSLIKDSLSNFEPELANDMITVLRILHWTKRKLSAAEILETFELPTLTLERVSKALEKIEIEKYVNWNPEGVLEKGPSPTLFAGFDHSNTKGNSAYEGLELHKDYAHNFLAFIDKPQSPSTYHSQYVTVPRGQFMPLAIKILELRNWIVDFSTQYVEEAANSETGSYLMQLDLNLFPITREPKGVLKSR